MVEKIKKDEDLEEESLGEFLERIAPLIKTLAPKIIEYQKIIEPRIKRGQYINLFVMLLILGSVFYLAYNGIIDGSATTGLLGAVIGFVFGGLYQQRNKN